MGSSQIMRVLVTGCAGHLGAAACRDLHAHGIEVRGIDLHAPDSAPESAPEPAPNSAPASAADGIADFHLLDLTAGQDTSDRLADLLAGVDAVLHLAAIPVPRMGTPADIFDLNCGGTFRLFQACADHEIDRIVVASSINAIGYHFGRFAFEIDYLPVDERHPKTTSDPYSFSKQITEEIGPYFARTSGIHSLSLRFGAGLQDAETLRSNLVPKLIQAREQVEQLAQMPQAAARDELARWQRHHDEDRRRDDGESELTPAEKSLMNLRHNFFSFVELGEACRAIRLALMHNIQGSQSMFIVDRQNALSMPADRLSRVMYPDVDVRGSLQGNQSLVDWHAATSIGFESEISAAQL